MTVTVATSGGEVRADAFATRTFTPTEERILIAALGLIGRQGVQRLGMAQIADAAGVARGTLYRYFPSRDHVLAAAADYDEARFSAGLDEVLDSVHRARGSHRRLRRLRLRLHPQPPGARPLRVRAGLRPELPARPPAGPARRAHRAPGRRPRHGARGEGGRPRPRPARRRHRPALRLELDHSRVGRDRTRAVPKPHLADLNNRRMDMVTEAQVADEAAGDGGGGEPDDVGHGARDGRQSSARLQRTAPGHADHADRHAERGQRRRC